MEDPGSLSALVLGCIDRSCREIPCLPLPAHRRLASRPRGGWDYGSKPIPSRPRFCFAWQLLKVALAGCSGVPASFQGLVWSGRVIGIRALDLAILVRVQASQPIFSMD